ATDAASVAQYNQHRLEVVAANPITGFQILLQMVHRIMAVLILAAVALCAWSSRRRLGNRNAVGKVALGWLGLIFVQAILGAATIWSGKAADVATAHVIAGALSLATGALMSIVLLRRPVLIQAPALEPAATTAFGLRAAAPEGLG